jgi:putative flavoprotein involved in K+ transport
MAANLGEAERIDTLVIGGGQAGLSAGYYLKQRGIPFLILDADARIGDHWREHWDSLRLYSPARSDGLPGMPFPASGYAYPTGRQMGDYLEAYAARFGLPVRSGIRVDSVRAVGDGRTGYLVSAGDERFEAAQVVVAAGSFRTPLVPAFAGQLDPGIRQLHSSEYRNLSQLQNGPVLVVGVSHSGADVAFEAASAHRTFLSGKVHGQLPLAVIDTWRARIAWPVVAFLASHVLTIRTPIGRKMAIEVRKGGGPLLRIRLPDLDRVGVERYSARTVGARGGKPVLDDGTVLDVSNVIWCTGFRQDYGWIELPDVVDDDGWPRQQRGVAPTPGLYFLGIPFQYAFTSMLVGGAGRDARYVVDRIAERAQATRSAGALAPARASR